MAINRKPIRILQVFARMDRGGAETMIMELYRNVDRSKIQFDFVVHTTDKCAFDEEILALGGKIHRIPKYSGKNHFKYIKKWNNLFSSYPEYKIIHAHVRSTASIFLKIAKKYGLITIAHSHSTSNGKGFSALVKNIMQLTIKHNADYLFAASKKAGAWLFGKGVTKKENFYVLKNSIDTRKFLYREKVRKHKRAELGINTETVIGHVGNFKKVKNHSFLIDIFQIYNKLNPNSLLILIGDGDTRKKIEKKIIDYNLTNKVKFLGARSDVNDLLQAMDVFVFPSFFEGLPVTLIEAQAAGLPVLAADTITEEVRITDLVSFKSIESDPKIWAKEIENIKVKSRKNMQKEVILANYDVRETASDLQKYYLSIIEEQMNV